MPCFATLQEETIVESKSAVFRGGFLWRNSDLYSGSCSFISSQASTVSARCANMYAFLPVYSDSLHVQRLFSLFITHALDGQVANTNTSLPRLWSTKFLICDVVL